MDDYDWYSMGQWIYIDDLRIPGNFCVSAEVDPLRAFTEKTRANNTAASLVRITSEEVTVIREGC